MYSEIVLVIFIFIESIECSNEVQTSSGIVRGLTIEVLNTTVDQYLGIPYAKPPIGSLRFARPQPIINGSKVGNKFICDDLIS